MTARSISVYENINWEDIFHKIDTDNDGLILRSELKNFLLKYPLNRVPLPEDLIDALLYHVDFNADGFIDLREFYNLVNVELDPQTKSVLRRTLVKIAFSVAPLSQVSHSDRLYIEHYMCCPPPLFIPLICLAVIAVFIYYVVIEGNGLSPYSSVDLNSPLVFDPHKKYEAWRFVSYMLIHAGYAHLLSNIFVSLLLGIPLEMVHRWWRMMLLFMAGVVSGSIVASLFSPESYLVGASGGCYAIIAAHLANIIINWKEMPFNWLRLLLFTFLIGADIGTFIYYTVNEKDTNVSYSAHLAGFIAGLLVGMAALRNLKEHRWEVIVKWTGLAIYLILLVLAIIFQIVTSLENTDSFATLDAASVITTA